MKILYVGTHGPDDSTRAALPFHMASGALDAGFETKILLVGDAALVMKDTVSKEIKGVAMPPLVELTDKLAAAGVAIVV